MAERVAAQLQRGPACLAPASLYDMAVKPLGTNSQHLEVPSGESPEVERAPSTNGHLIRSISLTHSALSWEAQSRPKADLLPTSRSTPRLKGASWLSSVSSADGACLAGRVLLRLPGRRSSPYSTRRTEALSAS